MMKFWMSFLEAILVVKARAEHELTIDPEGWLVGRGVTVMPAHPSWYYDDLLFTPNDLPGAIVAHYTATSWGTAKAMHKRRTRPRTSKDRATSWHATIDHKGHIWQMVPFLRGAWHAGGRGSSDIPGVGDPNRTSIGIELEGFGDSFPAEQVAAARWLWRALVRAYGIPRCFAMIPHSSIKSSKPDPGAVWLHGPADNVLDFAYQTEEGHVIDVG